jgi:LysM repeat protein
MKTFLMSLAAGLLIAGLVVSPAAAAPTSTVMASGTCGDTYTVQYHDYLSKISQSCGISVSDLLALNPQITNANIIYTGEIIRLNTNVDIISRTTSSTYYNPYTTTTTSGYARVTVSSTRAVAGDDVIVSVSGFPAYSQIDYRVGIQGEDPTLFYDGTITSSGTDSQTITIPDDAAVGEYWVVDVITTSIKDVVEVKSHTIYIGTTYASTTYTGYARVSLSKTQTTAGSSVTVTVNGFPAYSEIDYRVAQQGEDPSVIYDGTVGSNGSTSQVITIPSSAVAGEYWVVKVMTTSLRYGVTVTSHSIYITN